MPSRLPYSVSSGIMITSASKRGSTRKSIGLMPRLESASISSFTFMVPRSGRVGRAGAPRHDDRGHDRRHLAHHRDRHQVRHVDAGAELLAAARTPTNAKIMPIRKLMRLTIGSASAPASWMATTQVGALVGRAAAQPAQQGLRADADEGEELQGGIPYLERGLAHLGQESLVAGVTARVPALLDGEREVQQPARAFGQAVVGDLDAVPFAFAANGDQCRQQGRVPVFQRARVELHARRHGG